jgi:hypothetical protein
MTTPLGIAHCIARLSACPDLPALRRVWESLGVAYQRHPRVLQLKEQMKASFEGQKV